MDAQFAVENSEEKAAAELRDLGVHLGHFELTSCFSEEEGLTALWILCERTLKVP